MIPNNLVVTVISARGLQLKGHSKLEAFVSLTLNDGSSWKSKVHTDVKKSATGECYWNQRCEFEINGLDPVLTVSVYHRTIIGKSECIGVVQMPLTTQLDKNSAQWFHLRKKSALLLSSDKYRGEVQLKFEFSNKISTSSLTLNTISGGGKLQNLKRKIHLGKRKDHFSDTASIAGLPGYSDRSSLASPDLPHNLSQLSFNSDGLIVPPSQLFVGSGPTQLTNPSLVPGDSISSCSRRPSTSSLHPSRASSPLAVSETDEVSVTVPQRAQSTTSSGFSSTRSSKIKRPPFMTFCEDGSCCEELRRTVEEQRLQLAFKDAKIRDLQEYIDRLVSRVMENDPGLLECSRLACAN